MFPDSVLYYQGCYLVGQQLFSDAENSCVNPFLIFDYGDGEGDGEGEGDRGMGDEGWWLGMQVTVPF